MGFLFFGFADIMVSNFNLDCPQCKLVGKCDELVVCFFFDFLFVYSFILLIYFYFFAFNFGLFVCLFYFALLCFVLFAWSIILEGNIVLLLVSISTDQ